MLNQPKSLFISIIVLVIICICLSIFFVMRPGQFKEVKFTVFPHDNNATSSNNNVATTSYVEFVNTDGETIYFRDPRVLDSTTALGGGIFQLTPILTQNAPPFGVVFNERDASFAVGLESEPLADARLKAEAYLRSTLQVSDEQLCELSIFVAVPSRVNQFYSGKNLGLSFCPGATVLQ